jgi:hypothetical protein
MRALRGLILWNLALALLIMVRQFPERPVGPPGRDSSPRHRHPPRRSTAELSLEGPKPGRTARRFSAAGEIPGRANSRRIPQRGGLTSRGFRAGQARRASFHRTAHPSRAFEARLQREIRAVRARFRAATDLLSVSMRAPDDNDPASTERRGELSRNSWLLGSVRGRRALRGDAGEDTGARNDVSSPELRATIQGKIRGF